MITHVGHGESPFHFSDGPYLYLEQGGAADALLLLPRMMSRARSTETAQACAAQFSVPLTLYLDDESIIRYEGNKVARGARPLHREIILWLAPDRLPAQYRFDSSIMHSQRNRYFLAWNAFHQGRLPRMAKNGGLLGVEPTEIHRFLLAAHHLQERNPLLSLPLGGDELIRTLSWYDDLRTAWRGGWVWKHWRAWMAEVALSAGLFCPAAAHAVGRIHSAESSKSGASPNYFGQALARELPDLFAILDKTRLVELSKETVSLAAAS